MEQIVRIAAQCGIRHAADSLLIQKAVDPSHFPTGAVRPRETGSGRCSVHAVELLGISQASLLQQAVKLMSIATADEEAVGIVALGQ